MSAGVRTIAHDEARALLDGGGAIALDVRTPGEYEQLGHIPDAWLLPVDLVASAPAVLPDDGRAILVYCEHGVRSVAASRLLVEAGVPNVLNLAGGLAPWTGPREFGSGPLRGPSPWLIDNADLLPRDGKKVLDVACGRGRHSLLLASAGFDVHAIDRNPDAIAFLRSTAERLRLSLTADVVDLEGDAPPDLTPASYDAVFVFNYLHRPLMPALCAAPKCGGRLFYETFTARQAERGHPTNPAFLLEDGELPRLVSPLKVLRSREGDFDGRFVASIVAERALGLLIAGCLLFTAACSTSSPSPQPAASGTVTLFEGARLITGQGEAPIENSAFIVENGRFSRVGANGELQTAAGAVRIDLAGKTVIPALVDAHSHIGYMKDLTSGPQNYTRENILDHLYRFAYFGIAASQAMGTDFGEMPFQLRDEVLAGKYPDAARFLTAGRGLAPLAEISPDNMRHAAYAVTTEEGARAAVQELALRKVKLVKTWVDDRGGTVKKLPPNLYRAIIDEAHKQGLRVAVHATQLDEAKNLLRAGVDVFAHMVSDVDDELVALFKQHPNSAVLLALGGPRRTIYAPWLNPPHPLVAETVLPAQITRLQDRLAAATPDEVERASQAWARLARGIARLNAAGVTLGVGTDGGGQTGDQFVGWTMHTEMENMVAAGMTPAQVVVAATRTAAGILGLDDLGLVAPGKSADFVVLDANPLDDITNTRRISSVYLRGKQVDRVRLRQGFQRER